MSPTMALRKVVIFLITFINHGSSTLSKKPLFQNHYSKRRVTRVVLFVDESARENSQRSLGKTYAGIVTFDVLRTGNKSSLTNNFPEPLERIFVIVSASKMNEVRGNIDSAHASNTSNGSRFFEIADVLACLKHVANIVIHANYSVM